MAVKNPDKQKKEKRISVNKALDMCLAAFRKQEFGSDVLTKINRKAEEEVIKDILSDMADENDKVPKFKGGRFKKRENVSAVTTGP